MLKGVACSFIKFLSLYDTNTNLISKIVDIIILFNFPLIIIHWRLYPCDISLTHHLAICEVELLQVGFHNCFVC